VSIEESEELQGPIGSTCKRRSPNNPSNKRRMVKYKQERAKQAVHADYLGPSPIFDDRQFARFFRITPNIAEWIVSFLAKHEPSFWTKTYDCTGKPSIDPHVKFIAAQNNLCYGVSFSAFQDYFQMGDSTAWLCVSKITRCIVDCPNIAEIYLRKMNKHDARKTAELHRCHHNDHGMLGSLDVMKVHSGETAQCLRKGNFSGRRGFPQLAWKRFVITTFGSGTTVSVLQVRSMASLYGREALCLNHFRMVRFRN